MVLNQHLFSIVIKNSASATLVSVLTEKGQESGQPSHPYDIAIQQIVLFILCIILSNKRNAEIASHSNLETEVIVSLNFRFFLLST